MTKHGTINYSQAIRRSIKVAKKRGMTCGNAAKYLNSLKATEKANITFTHQGMSRLFHVCDTW